MHCILSCLAPSCTMRGNTKGILVMYEEDAEDWAVYLRKLFSQAVETEGILLYRLEHFSLRHLESLSLTSYKCKLLILSGSVLSDLTPKKCEFLEKMLDSPNSVVTLLCGLRSAAPLYESLNIPAGRWELSTEQQPRDYISVIQRVLFRDSEAYLEVSVPAEQRVNNPEEMKEKNKTEGSSGTSRSAVSLAMVLPAEVPCENPGEIFIFLKDEVVGETVEAEFVSHAKYIRARLALWDKNVWCMKALDFPPGPVNVRVYCDGILTATGEMKYSSPAMVVKGPTRAADSEGTLCWNDIEELDGILASIFKHEIPYYDFQSLQSEICPQNEYMHINELPTLLHCAAKFGLKNLALHLLQCSGANWASKMKNTSGADPAHIAKKYGHEELKKIFEDFSIQEISRNNEQLNDDEKDRASPSAYSPWKTGESPVERSHNWNDFRARQETRDEPKGGEAKKEDEKVQEAEEDPYTFAKIDENEYDMILSNMSVKKKPGSQSFIMNRPPAPTPRPTTTFPKEETMSYIAQVFQQKAARRQSDSDKSHGLPKKPDKARMESPAMSIPRGCLAAGQEELILLQEKVKNGKLSVDEALEKFKHWQMGKSSLEMIQQEKLRQLRDNIIGKRPEEENICDKLIIVHHPSGTTAHNENMLHNTPFSNKVPAPLQVEKEFGFCCRKYH
ncbi:B-cell scaffold protein with ankyrin repeats isoform X2 [Heterocephalus glaber]|uniref:B-cell scaffold protein with ankyrin repeats n=1 Tax=Heterocephalus glaber TaxID=10181 RepID=A0AAX6RWF3_HETGA|nr:B-cell scaffold protein with ankyrin repeats isoform X2 [Heterocephalus glaber]